MQSPRPCSHCFLSILTVTKCCVGVNAQRQEAGHVLQSRDVSTGWVYFLPRSVELKGNAACRHVCVSAALCYTESLVSQRQTAGGKQMRESKRAGKGGVVRWGERSCRCSRRPTAAERRSCHSRLCAAPTRLIQFSWFPPPASFSHRTRFCHAASHTPCLAPLKSNTHKGVFDD